MSSQYRRGGGSGIPYAKENQQVLIEVPDQPNIFPEKPEKELLREKKKIKKSFTHTDKIITETPFKEDKGKV